MIANPPTPQILGVGMEVGGREALLVYVWISPIYQILDINFGRKKMQIGI
jgi:hypothetical protein